MLSRVLSVVFSTYFISAIIRRATPLLFASMAALLTSKSGTPNLIVEGVMLMSSLMGAIGSALSGSLLVGMLCGVAAGVSMALFYGVFVLKFKSPANLTGISVNMFTIGFSVYLCKIFAGDKGTSSALKSLTFPEIDIPLIKEIPILGEIISGHNILTYAAFLTVILVYIFIYKLPIGLRIRMVGESPDSARSVGENPDKIKFLTLILSAIVASFGGMFLSMGYLSWWITNMPAGRGYIGVAANTVGKSNPLSTLLVTMMFAVSNALDSILQSFNLPSELTMALPYIVTLLIFIFGRRSIMVDTRKRKKQAVAAYLNKRAKQNESSENM